MNTTNDNPKLVQPPWRLPDWRFPYTVDQLDSIDAYLEAEHAKDCEVGWKAAAPTASAGDKYPYPKLQEDTVAYLDYMCEDAIPEYGRKSDLGCMLGNWERYQNDMVSELKSGGPKALLRGLRWTNYWDLYDEIKRRWLYAQPVHYGCGYAWFAPEFERRFELETCRWHNGHRRVLAARRQLARVLLGRYLRRAVARRAVALYWMEQTQRALCAPGGAGRAADRVAFESEFA